MKYSSVLVSIILALFSTTAYAADYEGSAVVVDRDTIEPHVGDKVISVRL
jgi:hypothetical protein